MIFISLLSGFKAGDLFQDLLVTEGGDTKLNVELETLNTSFFTALPEAFAVLLLAVLRESLVLPKGILMYQWRAACL